MAYDKKNAIKASIKIDTSSFSFFVSNDKVDKLEGKLYYYNDNIDFTKYKDSYDVANREENPKDIKEIIA